MLKATPLFSRYYQSRISRVLSPKPLLFRTSINTTFNIPKLQHTFFSTQLKDESTVIMKSETHDENSDHKEEKEEKKKDKSKSGDKLYWILAKQVVKYGFRGLIGAVIAWIFGWFPDPIQNYLDGSIARKAIEDATHLGDSTQYVQREYLDAELAQMIGHLWDGPNRNQAIIIFGEKLSGKTSALNHAIHGKPYVVKLQANTCKNELEFSKMFYHAMGLWHNTVPLNNAFQLFAIQCKQIIQKQQQHSRNRNQVIIPTLIIEDLNFDKGREDMVDLILSQARSLSAEKQCCRVIITVTDPLVAASHPAITNEKGRIKILQVNDFTEKEALRMLQKGSLVVNQALPITWKLNDIQQNQILEQIGTRPGELYNVMAAIHENVEKSQPIVPSTVQKKSTDKSTTNKTTSIIVNNDLIDNVLRDFSRDARVIVDSALASYPEAEDGLRQMVNQPFRTPFTFTEARKLLNGSSLDKDSKPFQVLLQQKRVLALDSVNGTIQVNNKSIYTALKSKFE